MILSTETHDDRLDVAWTASTVIAPEELLEVKLSLSLPEGAEERDAPVIMQAEWDLPYGLKQVTDAEPVFPVEISAESRTLTFRFLSAQETFGEMSASLELKGGGRVELNKVWISIFWPRTESDPEGLSAEGRRLLVAVVNFVRAGHDPYRNGHIFLADYVAFFADFLNIQIPEAIARMVSRELDIGLEGLPLDHERRLAIIHGLTSFYGIVRLQLEAEEECVEDDLRPVEILAQRELPDEDIEEEV